MRIVYLHQYFNTPEMSGSTRSYEMARRWVARGHDVHVVTSSREPDAPQRWNITEVAGITVHSFGIPYSNTMSMPARLAAFFKYCVVGAFRARALRGDVVYATSTPLTVVIPAVWATLFRRQDFVFEVRDLWPTVPIAMGKLRNPLAVGVARGLEQIAYRRSAAVVALSPGMAEGVMQAGTDPGKIVVAPNSCDVDEFDVEPSVGRAYREQQDWLQDRKLMVYCGTFGEVNDVSYLVRLAAVVRGRDPQIAFALYGSGAEEVKARELARSLDVLGKNVFFPGRVPKKELPTILSASTVACSTVRPVPELEANSANKFFDALAARRPMVVNHGGWQADLIRSVGAGAVLSPYDLDSAADTLLDLMQDDESLARAGASAAEAGRKYFLRDDIAARVLRTLEAVADRRQVPRDDSELPMAPAGPFQGGRVA